MPCKISVPTLPTFSDTRLSHLITDYLINHLLFHLDVLESDMWADPLLGDLVLPEWENNIKDRIDKHAKELSKET